MLDYFKNSVFIANIWNSIKGFVDFRVILLIGLTLLLGYAYDPKATIGLIHFCFYIFGVWGLALLIGKIFRIGSMEQQEAIACGTQEGNALGAAIVYFANAIFRVAVAISVILWWKSF